MPSSLHLRAVAGALALAACHGSDRGDRADLAPPAPPPAAAPACPALAVAIDGVPRTDLTGLAVTLTNGIYRTEQVMLFAGAAIDCAAVLAPSFRLPAGAIELRAYYHPDAQGLGTEAHTELVVPGVTLLRKADATGATTSLCVRPTTFTPTAGVLAGRAVAIAGTVAGAHCGILDLTSR
ncbi:MAG: hypothetical protein JNK64_32130 [Myxococcales bacterium]|nr:hypothetical protein [Myxococcales bacterium]